MSMICLLIILNLQNETFLPQWMTPEESLRIDEVGRYHRITAPPGGWVVTPGEFEELRGVFITWTQYQSILREITREVVKSCKTYIIARSSDTINIKNYLTSGGISLDSVRFYVYPFNAVWIRDYGPWFIRKQDNSDGIVDFIYNRPRPADDTIPRCIGRSFGIPVYGSPLTHPGGNFMVDGLGVGFASTLIDQENPGQTRAQIESLMYAYNGLEKFIVLQRINIEYTGHIDLWTKILNDTLVMVGEYAPGHQNHTLLNQHADSIRRCKNGEGFNFRVVRIPMPWSTSSSPPTYLNSLIVNNSVLVPTWGLAEDTTALRIYRQYLPGYNIVGIDCSSMSGSGGAIHCITMQVPSTRFLQIAHRRLPNTSDTVRPYRVRCQIATSASLVPESTLIFYKVNNGPFSTVPLAAVPDTQGVYAGYIPPRRARDTVYYYLLARNLQNVRRTSPRHVPPQIYSFIVTGAGSIAEDTRRLFTQVKVEPNPCCEAIRFTLNIPAGYDIRIDIFNSLGQRVKSFTTHNAKSGQCTIMLRLLDAAGRRFNGGAYFYQISVGQEIYRGKFIVVQ